MSNKGLCTKTCPLNCINYNLTIWQIHSLFVCLFKDRIAPLPHESNFYCKYIIIPPRSLASLPELIGTPSDGTYFALIPMTWLVVYFVNGVFHSHILLSPAKKSYAESSFWLWFIFNAAWEGHIFVAFLEWIIFSKHNH